MADIEISPREYVEKCDRLELSQLKTEIKNTEVKKNKMNLPDQIFYDSLESLKNKRHLLSLEDQNFINDLASKLS